MQCASSIMPTPAKLQHEVAEASPSKAVEELRRASGGAIGGPAHPSAVGAREIESLTIDEVSLLLQHLNLGKYVAPLRDLPMTGADLALCNEEDLKEAGVSFRPHRTRLHDAVQELKKTGVGPELLAVAPSGALAAAAPATYTRTSNDDECSFNMILADKIRECTDLRLPSLQDLRRERPDWVVAHTITRQAACDGSLVQEYCVISHRWETPTEPDTHGAQLKAIRAFLRAHPRIKYLWIDFSCMPQGERTPEEKLEFAAMLPHVNLLCKSLEPCGQAVIPDVRRGELLISMCSMSPFTDLGGTVLLLVDLSYLARFVSRSQIGSNLTYSDEHLLSSYALSRAITTASSIHVLRSGHSLRHGSP